MKQGLNLPADLKKYVRKYIHLYGTKEIIILPTEADTCVQCSVCAGINEKTALSCEHCGYTIVKTQEEIYL